MHVGVLCVCDKLGGSFAHCLVWIEMVMGHSQTVNFQGSLTAEMNRMKY